LDKEKNVYTWGRGIEGQLGLGDVEFQQEPMKVELPPVSLISCGGSHTLFVTVDGEVYSCGDDTWG
jgi:alpha-tubulin suppressor-like RCC1 family protein